METNEKEEENKCDDKLLVLTTLEEQLEPFKKPRPTNEQDKLHLAINLTCYRIEQNLKNERMSESLRTNLWIVVFPRTSNAPVYNKIICREIAYYLKVMGIFPDDVSCHFLEHIGHVASEKLLICYGGT